VTSPPYAFEPSSEDLPAVLIVDDIEANLMVLRTLLQHVPCSITSARSGDQALRLLLRQEFAVMLLDVQMPQMDGYEVAHHARSNPATRDVPIIFLTATHDSPENVARGYGSGAVDFLFKPIDAGILLGKVRVFLELYTARRTLADANRKLEQKNVELRALAEAESESARQLRRANEELQNAYRELQTAQAQLVQSAKMASLGELVAGVAHEINNPLAFVLSHVETIRRSLEQFREDVPATLPDRAETQWQRAHSRLTEVQVGLTRIRDLVLKLRTFSRLDEGERQVASVSECVDSVLTILGHRLKDEISVVRRLDAPDRLDCYPALLNQVLMNVLANAIDAIEAVGGGGTITIGTRVDADRFEITVADDGCGIAPEIGDRVFEPFFTTKPVGQGTGLGLSIAYSIVKKHEGDLRLTDAEGGGTIATIRLPLRPPAN